MQRNMQARLHHCSSLDVSVDSLGYWCPPGSTNATANVCSIGYERRIPPEIQYLGRNYCPLATPSQLPCPGNSALLVTALTASLQVEPSARRKPCGAPRARACAAQGSMARQDRQHL